MDARQQYAIPLSWRNALLSLALAAVLWLTPWLLLVSGRPAGRAPARKPLTVRYVRMAEGRDSAVWSVVFSTPTKAGFSKPAGTPESGHTMAGLLKPWAPPPSFLSLPPPAGEAPEMGVLTAREAARFHPETEAGRAAAPAASDAGGVRVEVDDRLVKRGFDAPALRNVKPGDSGPAWSMTTAFVDVDARGDVQHVLLESPSGQTNVDGAIVRALLTGKAAPGEAPARGRVRVQYWRGGQDAGEGRK